MQQDHIFRCHEFLRCLFGVSPCSALPGSENTPLKFLCQTQVSLFPKKVWRSTYGDQGGQFFNRYFFQDALGINSEHFNHRSTDPSISFAPGSPIRQPSRKSFPVSSLLIVLPGEAFREQKAASVSIVLLQDLTLWFFLNFFVFPS
jgi:hypothetical protein